LTNKDLVPLHPCFRYKSTVWHALIGALLWFMTTAVQAAPEPWPIWQSYNPKSTQRIDHSLWQTFLDNYLMRGSDGINRVNYTAARKQQWPQLKRYLENLSQVKPDMLTQPEQMAFWINLYNALTVDLVLQHPRKKSIKQMGRGIFSFGPWDDEVIQINGVAITLNDIEHRILRPIWRDHRIHYAVNCASLGCPDLADTVYQANQLESQLRSAESAFLDHPRSARFDQRGQLIVSSLFKWYADDFAPNVAALKEYLATHHSQSTRLRQYRGRIRYEYDWRLNATPD